MAYRWMTAIPRLLKQCSIFHGLHKPQVPVAARRMSDTITDVSSAQRDDLEDTGGYTITLIPGDGTGPEMIQYARDAIIATGAPVKFETIQLTRDSSESDIEQACVSIMENGIALKGNIQSDLTNLLAPSVNVQLRKTLDLYAYIVRGKSIPHVETKHRDVDAVVIRQNTEGEYSMLEHEPSPGLVESLKIVSECNCRRIAKFAFKYAKRNDRELVTAVHKANIMKLTDGMFLNVCQEVAKDFPGIRFNDIIIDNCAMQMLSDPGQFQVMVMPNLYGNVIGGVAAGIVGGPGLAVGANLGDKTAIFEQGTRNTGRSIVGQNTANPTAMMLAASDMLTHIGLGAYGRHIHDAVFEALENPMNHTRDIGGTCTTMDMMKAINTSIAARADSSSSSSSDSDSDSSSDSDNEKEKTTPVKQ